jgi:hypothetical protein
VFAIVMIDYVFIAGLLREFPSLATWNLSNLSDGPIHNDILALITWIVPIIIVEYIILVIPFATIFLTFIILVKQRTFDLSIVSLGTDFGGTRMLRRAIGPGLFSLAVGQLGYQLLEGYLYNPLPDVGGTVWWYLLPLMSIVSALVFLPVSLLIYMPTWLLNDAGIVSHLKKKQLDYRRCPETVGVGRWYSNLLSGFTLLAVPLTTFIQHFYRPLQDFGFDITAFEVPFIIRGLFLSIGIPFLAIAFVTPVIVFHEIIGSPMKRAMRRIAGAFKISEFGVESISDVGQSPDLVMSAKRDELKDDG